MSMRQLKITKSITTRESPSLEKYLQEISKVELLSSDDEVFLSIQIKQGCPIALQKLTKANLRFVVSVAKQYQNQGMSLSDLINEGNVGLIKAAQRFDSSKGFKFISYAVWWIRQTILQALADQSRIVRLPLNKIGMSSRILRAFSQLEQEFERTPTAEEIAQLLNLEIEEVQSALSSTVRHLSIDQPMGNEEEGGSFLDVMTNPNADNADKEVAYKDSLKKEIERSLTVLSTRQKEVIKCFFGIGIEDPLSLDDIGNQYHITRERVRQIKDKAIVKLQTASMCRLLRPYLGA